MIPEKVKKWLYKAIQDFNIARHELTFPDQEISTGPVCFLAQQAVEKLLKAYLVWKNIDFGKTHNLDFLRELCAQQDPEFKNLNLGNLNFYAIEIRYPDEFYLPSVEEARKAFALASQAKEFVFRKLGITDKDLEKKD